jgi:hypothetical protein
MALIYNKILTRFSGLNSVALGANGNLAAVAFHDSELYVYRIVEGPQSVDPSEIVNPQVGGLLEGGSLEECRFLRLSPSWSKAPSGGEIRFGCTQLAFLDEETLLVAREINSVGGGSAIPLKERANISLTAVNVERGAMVAEFTDPAFGPILAAPLLIPPKYVLFPATQTAICLDATSFREVFRIDASGEEQICANAVAFDPGAAVLYVLWGEYESSCLQTYRLHPDKGAFEPLERRPVLEGFEGNSLCLRPDGQEVAVWATAMEQAMDFREEGRKAKMACLGRLGLFPRRGRAPEADARFLDVESRLSTDPGTKCDFTMVPAFADGPDGRATQIGIFFAAEDYHSNPFYLDDHTVVINTPRGALLGVDTVSGKSEHLLAGFSPIRDLSVNHRKRLLLVGTEAGSFNLLGLA